MHNLFNELVALKIINPENIKLLYPRVRDRDDIRVMRCEESGVIFLDKILPADIQYKNLKGLEYWNKDQLVINEDDHRRKDQFKKMLLGKKILDVGCGMGGFLRLMQNEAMMLGIEIMPDVRKELQKLKLDVRSSLTECNDLFDVVTMFHMFEHLENPLSFLKDVKNQLKEGGKIVIEVPHARDALITFYNLEEFKEFTFWSQHIILHTRDSLKKIVETAGFKQINVYGYQRYGIANHLYWLSKKKPGGHEIWCNMNGGELDRAYSNFLDSQDMTDTIILTATK